MKLTLEGIKDCELWNKAGITLPGYDVEKVSQKAKEEPKWVHFGIGNIFRIFIGGIADGLLEEGVLDRAITCVETFDYDVVDKIYEPYDNLGLNVILHGDGTREYKVLGALAEAVKAQSSELAQWNRLKEIFTSKSLQMASFTITEKGYATANAKGEFFPAVAADFEKGPEAPESYLGKVVSLLYTRYTHGALPIAMVSMDNCSHNGDKLYAAVNAFAKAWTDNGLVEAGFLGYVNDQTKVTFPWSMIDKITPRPDAKVEAMLAEDHIGGLDAVVTSKNTYIAPFVNAEECEYLVIEDAFPNGKPALDKGGIIFTDRATVDKVEKMKVCTCLNPLHTALAIYGCLLGYTLISEEMKNPLLKNMVEVIGYKEGLPVVVNPGILDPKKFIDEVVNVRIPNPFLPDSPQRIATDTSQKLAIRFGETIKAYEERGLDKSNLVLIPLVLAGYARYLTGLDDNCQPFEISTDPLLAELQAIVAPLKVEAGEQDFSCLKALYSRTDVFGVDLYAVGLGEKIESMAKELFAGPGAVRATLHKYVKAR